MEFMLYEIPHYQSSHSNAVHSELDTVLKFIHCHTFREWRVEVGYACLLKIVTLFGLKFNI